MIDAGDAITELPTGSQVPEKQDTTADREAGQIHGAGKSELGVGWFFIGILLLVSAPVFAYLSYVWWDTSLILGWSLRDGSVVRLDVPLAMMEGYALIHVRDSEGERLMGPAIYGKDGTYYRARGLLSFDLPDSAKHGQYSAIKRYVNRRRTIYTSSAAGLLILGLSAIGVGASKRARRTKTYFGDGSAQDEATTGIDPGI